MVDQCFICRTGVLVAVKEKAGIARAAIFNRDAGANNPGLAGGGDDGEEGGDDVGDDDLGLNAPHLDEQGEVAQITQLLAQSCSHSTH